MSENKVHVSLKSMAEGKVEGIQKTSQFAVDPRIVKIEPGFNARPIDRDHVESMKESAKNGIGFPPIIVRVEDNQIILVDGHHRLTACLELIAEGTEYRRIDCMQFRGNDADRIMLMLTSAQGKPLTPLEMGFQYKKLIAFGWTSQEIASKVGKSRQHVEDMLGLSNAPAEVHSMIKDNKVSATLASATVKKHGARAATMLQDGIRKASESGAKKVTRKIMAPEQSPAVDVHAQIRAEERERCASICEAEGAAEIARIIRAIEK